jgi:hypothetical protein
MKSWAEWHQLGEERVCSQLMEDFLSTTGFTTEPVEWRFEPGTGIGSAQDIIANMEAALDRALQQKRGRGFSDPDAAVRVALLKLRLPRIVKVGAK